MKTSITTDVVPVLKSTRGEFARAVTQHKLDESGLQDCCDELEGRLGESEEAKAVLDSKVATTIPSSTVLQMLTLTLTLTLTLIHAYLH